MRREQGYDRRRKEEVKGFLMAAVWGILLGTAVVFAAMAMRVVAAPKNVRENMLQEQEAPKETKITEKEAPKETETTEQEAPKETETTEQEEQEQQEQQEEKVLYLTFDDGPSAENTDKVLDVLKERNVKATFFVIGEYVRKNPETAKRIVEEGHAIGIHCDVHDYGVLYQSVESYIEDFEKAAETVYQVTGVKTKLFRFPGGSVNAYNKDVRAGIIEEMEKRGYIYFDWNASLGDAVKGEKTSEELIKNAVDTALGRKRVVLLAHDRVEAAALALEELIDAFPDYRMEVLTEEVEPIRF